ncbi:MAG: nucleotidyltransferase family protein [Candidatus Woesearchaeota archaeon]
MTKAIILAGGFGTRLRPLTETTPKPLLPIKGKPIIEHAINNFRRHGILDIALLIGYKAEMMKEYFGDGSSFGVRITYCIEDEPLGTGGAIKRAVAENGIDDTFIAINGDNLADFDWTAILQAHRKNNAKVTLTLYPVEDVTQYGIAKLDGDKIIEFIEKPSVDKAPSNLNNAGGYVLEPKVLDMLPQGKCSLERDCFEILAKGGEVYAFRHEGQWFPTDDIEKYTYADEHFIPGKGQ